MRSIVTLVIACSLGACSSTTKTLEPTITVDYELHQVPKSKAVLVLFPGGGQQAIHTKKEFDILESAKAAQVSVLLMNFNRKLWLDPADAEALADVLKNALKTAQLKGQPLYLGGMSMGGNVALSLGQYLCANDPTYQPKGIFMVDSPIDLYQLYQNAQQDLANPEFPEWRLAEPRWIVRHLESDLGQGEKLLRNLETRSPFTTQTQQHSLPLLQQVPVRFYTEPDAQWWKENRGVGFERTNAFFIQNIHQWLKKEGWEQLELIETEGKGYRANGQRHPHSWSIVDIDGLLKWMGR